MRILAVLLALMAVSHAWSADVGRDTARDFAARWRGRAARSVRSLTDDSGQALLHVVRFEGAGFAVVGAEDTLAPIVLVTDQGDDLIEDARNPLWALVSRQLTIRREWQKQNGQKNKGRHHGWNRTRNESGSTRLKFASPAEAAMSGSTLKTAAASSIEDVRVAPLLQSTWDQGNVGNSLCYNYYTPSNYLCGCVATAVAQVMRYHEWPKTSVPRKTYTCKAEVNGMWRTVYKTMIGGRYDWEMMTLSPQRSPLTPEENRREIGKLCYDVGVAVHMQWTASASGTYLPFAPDALVRDFGYANADTVVYDSTYYPFDPAEFRTVVRTNCDAGLPLVYGISGASGGHAVVIDGYGYSGDDFFVHINPGWGGNANAWYCPPDLNMRAYGMVFKFSQSDELVYNIMPQDTGAIVSGCVTLAEDGAPVAGAAVSGYAVRQTVSRGVTVTTTNQIARVFTNDQGIYAVPTGFKEACTVYLTAEKRYEGQPLSVDQKVCCTMFGDHDDPFSGYYYANVDDFADFTVGNRTDVDFVLPRAEVTERTDEPVPFKWLAKHYPGLTVSDREACESLAQTTGLNGEKVWRSYVLGLDPTDKDSRFLLSLDWMSGKPVVRHNLSNLQWGWEIQIDGSTDLEDWFPADYSAHLFFKARAVQRPASLTYH